ncbi:MAG: DJ-1/PfpI family protein [Deltaproteobacteria bacterium]|nr:DJ-1/PfpI family protein [Deltaproteobacteria bacterium]
MAKVLVVLAEGFEELEAAAPITILRRAKIEVTTAGLGAGPAKGARGLTFVPDTTLEAVSGQAFDAVVLPGGTMGAANLKASALVGRVVREAAERGALIGAICAGPTVLGALGLLTGKRATSHATVKDELTAAGASYLGDGDVVQDGRIVTSRGAGTAVAFGLRLVNQLAGEDAAVEVAKSMMIGI